MSEHPDAARVVAVARSWIGTPYRHQASRKGVGCDCLGLVRGVWRAVTGEEPERAPPYTRDWAEAASAETLAQAAARHMIAMPLDEFGPGDVLLFRWRAGNPAKHAAIDPRNRRALGRGHDFQIAQPRTFERTLAMRREQGLVDGRARKRADQTSGNRAGRAEYRAAAGGAGD